jgi:uncharacterized protein DUF4440
VRRIGERVRDSIAMTRMTAGALALVASSVLLSWAQAPPSVTLPAPLQRVLTDYETAWRNKDASALAALFAEDGFVMSSGSPPVRGRAEIEKHYQGAGGPLYLRAYAFGTDGSVGWILGGYSGRAGGPDTGKFTLTLRQGPGARWLINSDMDNSNSRR